MADRRPHRLTTPGISCQSFYNRRTLETTSAGKNREDYRIVQEIPSDSSDDLYSDDSEDEWLPENNRDIGDEDDEGDAESQDAESQGDEGEEDEGQDAEGGQHDEGAVENVRMGPAQRNVCKAPACTQARKYVWKLQDNDFDGDLPPFLGDWKVNVEGGEPVDFFRHLFPLDLIDEIVHNTNMYALQKGKENLGVTSEEMQIFLGINMVMGYIRYPRARMYWSSEDGLRLGLIADAMSVNRFEQI
ncbi:PREDICTED: piggyBac transposable element-derived protein 2-like [Scomber scombrus]|uniref:PREDICTED: piggyBac transposable element-derived protein 2-like n=1 Tax=Scomber scombrus TaxID=13677 RepID=A0AAV1QGF2_SCOSC